MPLPSNHIFTRTFTSPINKYIDQTAPTEYVEAILDLDPNDENGYIYYDIKTKNNVVLTNPIRINDLGIPIGPTDASYSFISSTPANNIKIKRLLNDGIGLQKDRFRYVIQGDDNVNTYSDTKSYDFEFLSLQKSISVTKLDTGTGFNLIGNNTITNITTGTTVKLSKSDNRGDEASSEWIILKTDPNGSFQNIAAVLGVDYDFVTGNSISDIIDLQFLTAVNFTITNKCIGYTFSNNPYKNFPTDLSLNSDIQSYKFNTTSSSFNYELNFPKIVPVLSTVQSVLTISTNPLTTYANTEVLANYVLDSTLASYKKIEISTGNITLITKSDSDWLIELQTRFNIFLELREDSTNKLITSIAGLTPATIKPPTKGTYNLQYKLQAK